MKDNDRIGVLEAQMAEIRTLLGLGGPKGKPASRSKPKVPASVNAAAARKAKTVLPGGGGSKGTVYSPETRATMKARMRGRRGTPVADLSLETGISRATLWKWKRESESQ